MVRKFWASAVFCCATFTLLPPGGTGPSERFGRSPRITLDAALAGSVAADAQVQPAGPGGSIRGHVEILRPAQIVEPRPTVTELGMPAAHDQPDRSQTVVYLESAPASAFEDRPRERGRMTQRNETFVPHVLAIRAGTIVDFPNEDHTYHNVFSLSKTQRFDLGRYAAGQSKPVRFDRPGIVRVFCDIHSHMSAFILVFSHRFFGATSADGRYEISAVPPGRYTVTAWNDGAVRESHTVTMPEHGGAVEVDFMVR